MDTKRVLQRIDRRLAATGLNDTSAAKKAGKSDSIIRNWRRGLSAPAATTIAALAPALKTTAAWLLEGTGPEDPDADQTTIPVWGKAGAGGRVYSFRERGAAIGAIPAPSDANEYTGAVEIEGDSLGRIFDGWYAIYDEVRDPPTVDLLGRLCVLETSDGQVYVKRLKKGRGKRFTLESNYEAPMYDIEVAWAAPVKNLVP